MALGTLETEWDMLLKVVIVGESGVGKTAIMERYVNNEYQDGLRSTIGVDFRINHETIDNKLIKLQIWDTGGQERFRAVSSYYKGAHVFILVYDQKTEQSIDAFKNEIYENCHHNEPSKVPFLILENKADLTNDYSLRSKLFLNGYRRDIQNIHKINMPLEVMEICEMYYDGICKGRLLAQENDWIFYQVSAKTGLNINAAFHDITRKAYNYNITRSDRDVLPVGPGPLNPVLTDQKRLVVVDFNFMIVQSQ